MVNILGYGKFANLQFVYMVPESMNYFEKNSKNIKYTWEQQTQLLELKSCALHIWLWDF